MKGNVFISGGTGLVGSYLILELLKHPEVDKIFALVRQSKKQSAKTRLYNEIVAIDSAFSYKRLNRKLIIIEGDIRKPLMGIKPKQYKSLSKNINHIFNCAANTEFNLAIEELRKTNVNGVEILARFAQLCETNNDFGTMNHISSFVVAGKSKGIWTEDDLEKGQSFNNNYEQSKYEAELKVKQWRDKGLAINIFRLGVVVGDSKNGYTNNFKMLYQPIRLLSLAKLKEAPVSKQSAVPLCPIDYAVKAIKILCTNQNKSSNSTYHVFSSERIPLISIFDSAAKFFKYSNPKFIEPDKFDSKGLSLKQSNIVNTYLAYGSYDLKFNSHYTEMNLGQKFSWPKIDTDLLNKLFDFCLKSGYIKKSKPYQTSPSDAWVAIAAYNEERGLKILLPELKKKCQKILVVNDGSTDKTAEVAQANNVHLLSLPKNSGKGKAIKSAIDYLKNEDFDFLILLDGDSQHKAEDIPRFYNYAKNNSLELVIGNRMHNCSNMPWRRKFLNSFYSKLVSHLSKDQYPDVLCGYRIISRTLLSKLQLQCNGFEIEAELLLEARKQKAKIGFIEISCVYDEEVSHLNLISDTMKIAKFTFPYLIKRIRGLYP